MTDPRVERLAALLVNYSIKAKEGERIFVTGEQPAMPLVAAVYRELIWAGALPYVTLSSEALLEILLKEGNDEQLAFIPEPTRYLYEHYDARIHLFAPENTHYLSGVPREALQSLSKRSQPLLKVTVDRTSTGDFRWCGAPFPTQGAAQAAHMSLSDYEEFVYGACHVDEENPVGQWEARREWQQAIADYLEGKEQISVEGENIDMTLSVRGRTFINDDGHFNMPGGEVFTGPVEESVNGWVRFTYPAIYQGNEVEDVELTFEEGRVVQARAARNDAFLQAVLDTDPGARYLGEWAIGTNYGIDRFTRNILFDEKIGGTVHMALGAGYPETGNTNQSSVHWDMICDLREGAEIRADGELFYKGGEFLID